MSEPTKLRTSTQNRALHLYLTLVADALDREGFTMQDVVKAIRRAEIRPTPQAMKEVVWKPLQEVMYGKRSTTELERAEVDRVFEAMNKWLGEQFELHVPFPSLESLLADKINEL